MSEQDRTTEPTPKAKDPADPAGVPPTPQPESKTEPTAAPASRTSPPVTQRLGQLVVIGIAVLFGIFAVANSQYVDFNWIFGGTEVIETGGERSSGGVPLILLLVGAFVLGAILGRATTWRRTRHLKRELKQQQKPAA